MKDFLSLFGFVAKSYRVVSSSKTEADAADKQQELQKAQQEGTSTCDAAAKLGRRGSKPGVVVNRAFRDPDYQRRLHRRRSWLLVLAGVFSIGLGAGMMALKPYDLLFRMKIMFFDGGESFELWRKPPVDLFLKVYLFNITNADAFLSGEDKKLRFEEVGPYVYRELLEHANITFNENGTLSTSPRHPLLWAPDHNPVRREDDLLVLPHIALMSITHVMKDSSFFMKMGLNLVIGNTKSQPLVRMTAREFMFGYESTLTTLGNTLMPSWIYFEKVGLVDRMYDFSGDTATIFTGSKHLGKAGLIDTYRGSQHLPHWHGDHCSSVVGASDASKFPSLINPNDTLLMYRKSVCRAMPMVRTGSTVKNGLYAYSYKFVDGVLDNGRTDPRNKCFCRNGHCLQEGLIDVTDCYYGFPIAVSYPHFYKADKSLIEGVEGIHPDPEKHESRFLIQPDAGLPVEVKVRFQINMAMGDVSSFRSVRQFSNMVIPMLWTEVGMYGLPQFLNTRYYLYLNVLPVLEKVIVYLSFIVGVGLFAIVLLRVWVQRASNGGQMYDFKYLPQSVGPVAEAAQIVRRHSMRAKELDLYYSSLLVPPPEAEEETAEEDEDFSDVPECTKIMMDSALDEVSV
ncbi:scavenger receptor class B member 1-like [Schistocerca cancellata]|uniref:scavenger receptor class B member 1-like n=1 Tax=Schistocerca cancellata TaxID=274614 RepID=UPI00211969BA|nr:scavenger receptor class B member 1-like [Schistocerca cancellata]